MQLLSRALAHAGIILLHSSGGEVFDSSDGSIDLSRKGN
jgi:hypothetical protein